MVEQINVDAENISGTMQNIHLRKGLTYQKAVPVSSVSSACGSQLEGHDPKMGKLTFSCVTSSLLLYPTSAAVCLPMSLITCQKPNMVGGWILH